MANEGLVWKYPSLKMFQNPGGDDCILGGGQPKISSFCESPLEVFVETKSSTCVVCPGHFFSNVRHAVQLFFLSSVTLSIYESGDPI